MIALGIIVWTVFATGAGIVVGRAITLAGRPELGSTIVFIPDTPEGIM